MRTWVVLQLLMGIATLIAKVSDFWLQKTLFLAYPLFYGEIREVSNSIVLVFGCGCYVSDNIWQRRALKRLQLRHYVATKGLRASTATSL